MSGKTSTTGERRSHPRVEVHFPLESVLLGNALAGIRGFATETLDLGEGGARFGVPEELPIRQELALVLHLPNGTYHRCRARVLRSSPTWTEWESPVHGQPSSSWTPARQCVPRLPR